MKRKQKRRQKAEGEGINFLFLFLIVLLFFSCGRKMPPPGKPDIDPPSVTITEPEDGDTVKGEVEVHFIVQDKSKIKWVALFIDNKEIMKDSTEPFSLSFIADSLEDTLHTIKVKASDEWDNTGESGPLKVWVEKM